MSTQAAIESMRELARLRTRVEALETSVKFGAVEFVLEDAIKKTLHKTRTIKTRASHLNKRNTQTKP